MVAGHEASCDVTGQLELRRRVVSPGTIDQDTGAISLMRAKEAPVLGVNTPFSIRMRASAVAESSAFASKHATAMVKEKEQKCV